MNATTDTTNFTLLRLQREIERQEANLRELSRSVLRSIDETNETGASVSNNLGVYFYFVVWFSYSCSFSLS